MSRKHIAVMSICTALAALAVGQESATERSDDQPTFTNQVEVTVANIDVFVRDTDGRPVTGLDAADFRVLMDGVEVAITNFSELSSAPDNAPADLPDSGQMTAPTVTTSAPPAGRAYVVLVIDNENLNPLDRTRVMNGIRTFVDDVTAEGVQVMVVTTRRSIAVRQQFTDDRDAIAAALDQVSEEASARMAIEFERRRLINEMEEFAAAGIRYNYFDYLDLIDARVFKATMQGQITAFIEAEVAILRDTTQNLFEIVRMMSGLEGRRSLVYVSNGLSMTPGVELLHEFAEVFLDTSVYSRIAQHNFQPEFRKLVNVANREGVSLHTIDATGLRAPLGFDAEDRFVPDATASWEATGNQHESLRYMADTTGGIAVLNTNDVTSGLRRIRDDLSNYYSVGYRIIASGDDTAHEIEIQIPDHPEFRVRHRQLIVEKSLDTTVRERVLQTLIRDLEFNPLELQLTTGPSVEISARRWELPLIVSIPVNRLGLTPAEDDLVAHLELFICVRDERGRETPVHQRVLELRIPRTGFAPEREQRYELSLPMTFREERHVVAVGLVDRVTEQTSYHRIMVEVP